MGRSCTRSILIERGNASWCRQGNSMPWHKTPENFFHFIPSFFPRLQFCRPASATPACITGEAGPVPWRAAVDAGGSSGAAQKMVPLSPEKAGRACVAHNPASESARKPGRRRGTGVARKNTPNGTRRVSPIKLKSRHPTCPGRNERPRIAEAGLCPMPLPPVFGQVRCK